MYTKLYSRVSYYHITFGKYCPTCYSKSWSCERYDKNECTYVLYWGPNIIISVLHGLGVNMVWILFRRVSLFSDPESRSEARALKPYSSTVPFSNPPLFSRSIPLWGHQVVSKLIRLKASRIPSAVHLIVTSREASQHPNNGRGREI